MPVVSLYQFGPSYPVKETVVGMKSLWPPFHPGAIHIDSGEPNESTSPVLFGADRTKNSNPSGAETVIENVDSADRLAVNDGAVAAPQWLPRMVSTVDLADGEN